MTITFWGNFMSHHETPLGLALENIVGKGNYHFVVCEPLHAERTLMCYEDMNKKYDFVVRPYENATEYQKALQLAETSDVAIIPPKRSDFLRFYLYIYYVIEDFACFVLQH